MNLPNFITTTELFGDTHTARVFYEVTPAEDYATALDIVKVVLERIQEWNTQGERTFEVHTLEITDWLSEWAIADLIEAAVAHEKRQIEIKRIAQSRVSASTFPARAA